MKKPTINYYDWVQQLKAVARETFGFTENGIAHTDWDAFKGIKLLDSTSGVKR